MSMTEKVAIVGSGLIGRAWAISFARGGHRVSLFDPDEKAVASALGTIADLLSDLELRGMLAGQRAGEVRARIEGAISLEEVLSGAVHVQENAPEDVEIKRQVFAKLDAAVDGQAVLASSSSAILPSNFTAGLTGRSRCLVAHPINPPYLVPAVELVPAPWTEPEVVERTRRRLATIGQAPIVMRRELDGFIMNRLQGALLHEAFRLVAEGYASTEDVDAGICEGIGLRWAFMGPFETIDLNAPGGVRDYVARYGGLYRTIAQSQTAAVPWSGELLDRIEAERRRRLPRADLADRQRWRDRRLMALAVHKANADKDIGS
jgi:L-gulonate 3-dehydrogenase